MKKILIWAMVLTSIMCVSCAKSEEGDEDKQGSIYGIVTKLGTAEPMKAVGVELYKKSNTSKDALLLKTVTFDDGHFEFKDLHPENYQVKVVADGYEQIEEGYVAVEAGRQARIDLQVRYHNSTDYIILGNLMIQTKDLGEFEIDAAKNICKASRVAGYTDWRLPTIEELRTMYTEKEALNMTLDWYWSSSIADTYRYDDGDEMIFYYVLNFSTGKEDYELWERGESRGEHYVRAVRTVK